MERPIQRLGLNPDGVHRFMYEKSQDGDLYMWPARGSLQYGTTEELFLEQVDHLKAEGSVVEHRQSAQRMQYYQVAEPENYDSNDRYLGQRGPGVAPYDPRQAVLDAIKYTLEHRDEWDEDQVADFEDMVDEAGAL